MEKIPEKLGSEYYRGFLTRQGQAFYDRMNTQLLRGEYSGKTTFMISNPEAASSDCFAAYKAIRDDHPEYFYLGFQSEFIRTGQTGTLKYPILYTEEIIGRVQKQLRKSISRITRTTAHLEILERETLVYERIAKMLTYKNNNDVRDHNIVGPVLLSSGVCEGQNALLMLTFRQIGVPCIKVYGKTKDEGWHCWSIAWIRGTPVHCDVTWDGNKKEGGVRFDYFNLSDEQISNDHHSFKGPHTPACRSDELSYYKYNGLCVHSYEELKARIKRDSCTSPMLVHFSYHLPSGDYLKEGQRAISECSYGRHKLYYNPKLKNLAVIKE